MLRLENITKIAEHLLFPGGPQEVFLTTPPSLTLGSSSSLSCQSSPSPQGGRLRWRVEGRRGEDVTEEVVQLEEQETLWTEDGQVKINVFFHL